MYSLRPAQQDDLLYARDVYYQTSRWLIDHYYGWDEKRENEKFSDYFTYENSQIIMVGDTKAGWVQTQETPTAIEIDGIYIAPEFQNKKIGTTLITTIIKRAESAKKSVLLGTAKISPALSLYKRLGFVIYQEEDRKFFMRKD